MPIYQFENTETGEVFDKMMSYDDMKQFVADNPNVKNLVGAPKIVSGVGFNLRPTDAYREQVARIKDTYKINNIRDH